MDIELYPLASCALEAVAQTTLLPAANLADALVAAGLLGWSPPVGLPFWRPVIEAGRWPVIDDDLDHALSESAIPASTN